MIIQELRAEFKEYFQSPDAELILWLDPRVQWKGTTEHLEKDFKVVEYRGSQLEVKAEVELTWAKGERPAFVLYLPGLTRDKLTVLKEYEFSGKVFEETILQSFKRWGIEFEREHEAELEKILPILVTRFATKARSFWQAQLTPENVRALLFDDEPVRKMLAAPDTSAQELKDSGAYEIFCDFAEDRFGGPRLRDNDPTEWARLFTTYLFLTEVRVGTGRPPSFPEFDIKWADDRHEGECLSFVRDWLQNATYKDDFKRLSSEVERKYDLSPWAAALSESPTCESSLSVEKTLESNILSRISNIGSLSELRGVLSQESEAIERMTDHFWSREGDIVAWRALRLASTIIRATDDCLAEVARIDSPGSLVQRYVQEWWRIDRDYRGYRARYDGENRLSKLSMQVVSIYREFQNQLNEKLGSMIEAKGDFAIEGIERQSSFWARSVSASKRRRAIFLVDALRFELACELKGRLEEAVRDAKIKCVPLISSIPTLTPIGMASIVSGEEIEVDLSTGGNWNVRSVVKGESRNLSIRAERKKFLKKRHPRAAFYDLEEILKPSELSIGDGNPIIIFTKEMDGLGHESGVLNLSLDYLGQYLDGLARASKRLGAIGIDEIHMVSDHGFIILDEVTDADKVTIPKEVETLYEGHRCLVGEDFPVELGIVLELPNSSGLRFCVPRGTGIFKARGGNEFFHGGLSLQESIVPYIQVAFAKAQPKYRVMLKAPEVIHNLIFEVELLRAFPADGVLLGVPRFVEIVGILAKDNAEIFRQSGPDIVINEQKETTKVRLRIKPGTRFSYRDLLNLELRDADTSELLDSAEVVIKVESNE